MYSSRARSSSSPISLSATALQPLTPLQLAAVASGHAKSSPPPRSYPGSPTRNRSRKLSKSKSSFSAYSSSTSVTSDSSSSVYSFAPSEPPTVIPSKKTYSPPLFLKYRMHSRSTFASDEDDDDEDANPIYTRKSSTASLRTRLMPLRIHEAEPKGITTTPGLLGAGETETEGEDHLVCQHSHKSRSLLLPVL